MSYNVIIDHWHEETQEPTGYLQTKNVLYVGDDAAMASLAYQAACTALFCGGAYRKNIGVFSYTDGYLTDRYLMEDGKLLKATQKTVEVLLDGGWQRAIVLTDMRQKAGYIAYKLMDRKHKGIAIGGEYRQIS